jgi:hypothetical protein
VRQRVVLPVGNRTHRFSLTQRFLFVAAGVTGGALALLVAGSFVASVALDATALDMLGVAFLACYLAILTWRVPVLSLRHLVGVGMLWAVGIGVAGYLVLCALQPAKGIAWIRSVQWLALTLSFAVGGLFLRTLLARRSSPVAARLLSLVSPVGILLLMLFTGR